MPITSGRPSSIPMTESIDPSGDQRNCGRGVGMLKMRTVSPSRAGVPPAPGTFSWPELATTDQKAGVAFYRALFGWDVNDSPIGPTEVYSTLQMRGKPVAAACTLQPQERQMGVPPHWNSYVTVANVDESA